jgi:hypothetical protein
MGQWGQLGKMGRNIFDPVSTCFQWFGSHLIADGGAKGRKMSNSCTLCQESPWIGSAGAKQLP